MPAKAGQIVINITAGTAQFVQDLDKARGKIHEFASTSVSEGKAVRAMFKDMEGDITNNSRAAEAFAEEFLGLGKIAEVAFPLTAGAAFGGMIADLIGKGKDWVDNYRDGAAKIKTAFIDLTDPLRQTNDELAVTNARLANDIAKLEGKPQNNLKLMLAEAVEQADKLAASTEKVLGDLDKLVKGDSVASWKSIIGQAPTGEFKDEFDASNPASFHSRIRAINDNGAAAIRAATTAKEKDAAQTALNKALTEAYGKEIEKVNGLLTTANQLQLQHNNPKAVNTPRIGMPGASSLVTADQSKNLELYRGALRLLNDEHDYIGLNAENSSLTNTKNGLSGDSTGKNQALETTARLTKELGDARAAQADSLDRITIEENNELQALLASNQASSENVELVKEIYDAKRLTEYTRLMDLYAKGLDDAAKQYQRLADATEKTFGEQFDAEIKSGIDKIEQGAKAAAKWAAEYNKITEATDSESLRHRVAMAGAGGSPNDPLGTLALQQSIERADIETRYEEKLKNAVSDMDRSTAIREGLKLMKLQDQMEEQTAANRHKNLRDFMAEMQGRSKDMGDILYDGAHEALDKIGDDFGKLVQHPKKTNVSQMFGDTFKSVGGDMTKEATKALLQKGLGSLGKLFGVKPPAGKPDGSDPNPFYVIVKGMKGNGLGDNPLAGMSPNLPPALGGKSGVGGVLGGIGGFIGKLFGSGGSGGAGTAVDSSITYMAGGGDMTPGNIYGLAEKGEAELVSPKYSSRVTPLSKLGGGDTHNHNYNIDARGADLGAGNRVSRAVEAAHNAAVGNSVRASAEHAKRMPKRKN